MTASIDDALALHRAGKLAEAERGYLDILNAHPNSPDVLHLLGALLHQRGAFGAAAVRFRQALALVPDHAEAQRGLSEALLGAGDLAEAEAVAARAVQSSPNHAPLRFTLATILRRAGKISEAIAAFTSAGQLQPSLAEAHLGLGVALWEIGQPEAAEIAYRQALTARPDYAEAWLNLGALLHRRGRRPEAIAAYEEALRVQPESAMAHHNLGVTRFDSGDLDGAEAAYRRALVLQPDHERARNNLAYLLQILGRYAEAALLYRQGMERGPNPATAARYLSLASLYDPAADLDARFAEQRRMEDRFARPLYADAAAPVVADRSPQRRLRIGYLTSDFRDHPVARNVEPLLVHRDPQRFEIFVYADLEPDATSERLKGLVDSWLPIAGMTDEQVAERIRADQVDILVVLAAHFDRNRPLVAARRPAPVQVSFHDLISSGMEAFDYFIADRTLHPRGAREKFVERVIRLPSFYSHAPLETVPPISPSPFRRNGVVTFGSFNNPAKVNDGVVRLWAEILERTPGSRLVLKFRDWFGARSLQRRIWAAFVARGVERDRIHFDVAHETAAGHLARYDAIDIALDPFPFSGSTTTFEALWMGVPVIAQSGASVAARWSASMLRAIGAPELVASSAQDYVEIAVGLANDPARLDALRSTLRSRVAASPLCDGKLRARQIERVYRAIWKRYVREDAEKLAAASFDRGVHSLAEGRLADAITAFVDAVERKPKFPEALGQLGVALGRQRDFGNAARTLRAALALHPDFAAAHANLGAALRNLGQFEQAEQSLRVALRLAPDFAVAEANLGLLLFDQGRIAEAIAIYDEAIERHPDDQSLWRNRIGAVPYDPARDERSHEALLRRFAERFAPAGARGTLGGRDGKGRRLRVAYVSSDFVAHPIVRNLTPLLERRDRAAFEVFVYSDTPNPNVATERVRALVDTWRDIAGRDDESVARLIADDGIDILVCLATRLDKARPLLATRRAAPVQIALYEPATSGLPGMDYLIADAVMALPRGGEFFTERVMRAPSFYVHAPLVDAPDPGPVPALARGAVTFGSFNNPAKLNDRVLALWGELLYANPGSRLVLKFRNWFSDPGLRSRVIRALGTTPAQVEFLGDDPVQNTHLGRYGAIDIALDPFPFTGSTTTFESLWMGTPVVTLMGDTLMGRWSGAMLGAVGLNELVARTPQEYLAIAAGLARDRGRLAAYRATLRERVAQSSLCDAAGRARHLERIFRAAWRRLHRREGVRA